MAQFSDFCFLSCIPLSWLGSQERKDRCSPVAFEMAEDNVLLTLALCVYARITRSCYALPIRPA